MDQKVEFSNLRQNIKIVKDDQRFKPVVLNLAVSAENGKEGYQLFPKALNSEQFCEIFEQIEAKGKKFICVLDNASI